MIPLGRNIVDDIQTEPGSVVLYLKSAENPPWDCWLHLHAETTQQELDELSDLRVGQRIGAGLIIGDPCWQVMSRHRVSGLVEPVGAAWPTAETAELKVQKLREYSDTKHYWAAPFGLESR